MACTPYGLWYSTRSSRLADPNMRVGDVERNQVADSLSQHFSEGRLDATELKERLDKAISAKTRGDLSGLMTDLPAQTPTGQPPSQRRRAALWVALIGLLIAISVPWQITPWPWSPGCRGSSWRWSSWSSGVGPGTAEGPGPTPRAPFRAAARR
jgi:hypothetical protein